MRNMRVCRQTI